MSRITQLLHQLETQHANLDYELKQELDKPNFNEDIVRELKKKKLLVKDEMFNLLQIKNKMEGTSDETGV